MNLERFSASVLVPIVKSFKSVLFHDFLYYFDGVFFNTGYVRAGYTEFFCDLTLGQGYIGLNAVTQGDDFELSLCQSFSHSRNQFFHHVAVLGEVGQGFRLVRYDIGEGDIITVAVVAKGFVEGMNLLVLFCYAEVHQNLVFNAAGSVGRDLCAFVKFERVYRLDKPDCAA